jgi:O-methyltransferase involved in polyketide biosynthesis
MRRWFLMVMAMNEINKTLYIPLYGKALVSGKNIILHDPKSQEIWDREGFPLKGKSKSKWLAYYMSMRAAAFDRWVQKKMEEQPDAAVLHLGCGMDSRAVRVDHGGHLWFDVDFPEVIRERKRHFSETEEYRMLGGDVRQKNWLEAIPKGGTAVVVMEGVSMYLTVPELLALLKQLSGHFDSAVLLMDTYTVFAAKATRYKNPINEVGVTQVYGFDDPLMLTEKTEFRFAGEHSLTPDAMIAELPRREQRFFRTMFAGKMAKKIYRLYEYKAKIRE